MPLTRRLFLALGLGAAAAVAACARPPVAGKVRLAPGTRLIMLRHADRNGSDLSETGRARAAALPAALEGLPIDVIYSPGIQRNLDTAAPLAAARGLEITRLPQERPAPIIAARSRGQSVVWVGNKGNLKSIWSDLDPGGAPPLEYGELFILTADATGRLRVERRRWGPA